MKEGEPQGQRCHSTSEYHLAVGCWLRALGGGSFNSSHPPPVSVTNPTRSKWQFHSSKLVTLCDMETKQRKDGPLWEGKFFVCLVLLLLSEPWDTFCTYTPHTGRKGHGDVFASTSIYSLFYLLKYHFCLQKTLGMVGFYALSTFPPNKTLPYKSVVRSLTSENTLIVSNSNIFHSDISSCQEY